MKHVGPKRVWKVKKQETFNTLVEHKNRNSSGGNVVKPNSKINSGREATGASGENLPGRTI
jgi:hypothetical protein